MIGLIIAAGNQRRFKTDQLKCMMPYGDSDTLTININTMLQYCRRIRIYTIHENLVTIASHIVTMLPDKSHLVDVIEIESGKGCGHAVFTALAEYMPCVEPVIIKWGDAIHNSIEYYIDFDTATGADIFIPCEYIQNPYTSLINVGEFIANILMRDEVEPLAWGWHDLSIFFIPSPTEFMEKVKFYMLEYENVFLKSILKMDIKIKKIETELISKSYNTIEEFNAI